MTRPRILWTLAAAAIAVSALPGVQAQGTDPAVAAVVERAGRYVTEYVDAFSAIVSDELQEQRLVRANGTVKQVRRLNSDFLLVKTGASVWPAAFHDVIAVDGKPVRNREDRLRKLFIDNPKTAVNLARAIASESGRYNIGIQRVGNSPLLPLVFLTPRIAPRVQFTISGSTVTFQEVKSPSVLSRTTGGKRFDMMSSGSFEIDPNTGRVLAAVFTAEEPLDKLSAKYTARYEIDPKLGLSVPTEATEHYWRADKPKDDRLEVRSTYSGFRKFQVSTTEQIKVPH